MSIQATDDGKANILKQIESFNKKELFDVGHGDLTENEEHLRSLLYRLKHLLRETDEIPPLLLLEIFIFTHGTGHPPLPFVLDWLYRGAKEFHQAEGQEHFERGLGFTVGRGANSGQGHEFKTARRNNLLQRDKLFFLIRCLNKYEGYTRDDAVSIVHLLHERQLAKSKRKARQPISEDTLLREYKAWKGKKDSALESDIFEMWANKRPEWTKLFQDLEQQGETLPTPKKKVKPIR